MRNTLDSIKSKFEKGELTSCELTLSSLSAIDEPDGQGRTVFVKVYKNEALSNAEAIDKIRKTGVELSPLAGVPISIKDLFDVSGEVTMAGSKVRKICASAKKDADIVSRLRAAGAILIGRTNMTEFAFSGLGLNPHYGTPLNPWDRSAGRIPGGSSSGAAVSVSDQMATAAIGTDTGGSVRIPAALCGLTGFKPTASRVSTRGAFPLSTTLDSIGPLANSVACCALLDQVMSGKPINDISQRSIGNLTLAVPQTVVLDDMDSAVAKNFQRTLSIISELGARIVEIPFEILSEIPEVNRKGGYAAVEAFATLRSLLEKDEAAFDPRVAVRVKRGATVLGSDYIELLTETARIRTAANHITRSFDALLMPTVPIVAPILKEIEDSDELYHNMNLLMLRNSSFGNFLDRCAVSLPINNYGEAPVGLMILGNTGEDEKILEIAQTIEKAIAST